MKKILIRVESHSKSGVGGLESRIFEFCKSLDHEFTFLTNSKFLCDTNYFLDKTIYSNYFGFFGTLREIFSFRDFEIIESNGIRDNFVATLNYLVFFPFYKFKNTKLILVIHGNTGILALKGFKKRIYDFILKIGFKISKKIIVISPELKEFFVEKYKISSKKIEIIPNFIKFEKFRKKRKNKNFLLVSRLDNAKMNGILKAINFCIENNLKLDIYGDGENLEKLEEIYKKNKNINFLGFKKQNEIDYKKYFGIFAMGRAILEGIANNLVGILISYDDIIGEVNIKNYSKIKYFNFSGRGIKKQKIDLVNLGEEREEIYKKTKNDFDLENIKDYYY